MVSFACVIAPFVISAVVIEFAARSSAITSTPIFAEFTAPSARSSVAILPSVILCELILDNVIFIPFYLFSLQ